MNQIEANFVSHDELRHFILNYDYIQIFTCFI